MIILRFNHVVKCINSSFLFIAERYSIAGVYHNLFVPVLVNGVLGYVQFGTIMNKAAIRVHIWGKKRWRVERLNSPYSTCLSPCAHQTGAEERKELCKLVS